MSRPNKKQQKKEQARQYSEQNRINNEIKIQQTIGIDENNPYHGPKAPDSVDRILNDHYNNLGPDFDNMIYSVDNSVYKKSWADINKQKVNLSVEDFDIKYNDLEFSTNESLNDFFIRALDEGNDFQTINARINKGFRKGKITEDEYNMAKKMLNNNKDYINNLFYTRKVASETTEQIVKNTAEEVVSEGTEDIGNQYLKRALSGRNINALMNLGFAVSDYNEARNSGDGVLKAGVKAGAQFVAGEMLGGWMFPIMFTKQLPTLAISTIQTTQNITRKMNSTTRIQTFGEAHFQDTQQLATMRQSGMELAKMSQYNLQQAIMGNEAQYMHRL